MRNIPEGSAITLGSFEYFTRGAWNPWIASYTQGPGFRVKSNWTINGQGWNSTTITLVGCNTGGGAYFNTVFQNRVSSPLATSDVVNNVTIHNLKINCNAAGVTMYTSNPNLGLRAIYLSGGSDIHVDNVWVVHPLGKHVKSANEYYENFVLCLTSYNPVDADHLDGADERAYNCSIAYCRVDVDDYAGYNSAISMNGVNGDTGWGALIWQNDITFGAGVEPTQYNHGDTYFGFAVGGCIYLNIICNRCSGARNGVNCDWPQGNSTGVPLNKYFRISENTFVGCTGFGMRFESGAGQWGTIANNTIGLTGANAIGIVATNSIGAVINNNIYNSTWSTGLYLPSVNDSMGRSTVSSNRTAMGSQDWSQMSLKNKLGSGFGILFPGNRSDGQGALNNNAYGFPIPPYCVPVGVSSANDYISYVDMSGASSPTWTHTATSGSEASGKTGSGAGYCDFVNSTANWWRGAWLAAGASITMSVGHAPIPAGENRYCKVWIDLNHDGVFNDWWVSNDGNGELVSQGNAAAGDIAMLPFTIPTNKLNGIARMRVALKRGSYPTPCEGNFNGEVEDYTITVWGGVDL